MGSSAGFKLSFEVVNFAVLWLGDVPTLRHRSLQENRGASYPR
jgi:hypothetical protein